MLDPGLEIVERHAPTTTTLALGGDLDLLAGGILVDEVRRALRRCPAVLRIDLRDVEFIDISGTRALIQCRRLAWAAGADFELTALSDPVRRLFALARMHTVFGTG